MTTAAETIASWATEITLDDIPHDVREHAKLHVLDTLGCGLAAHSTGVAGEGRACSTTVRAVRPGGRAAVRPRRNTRRRRA